MVAFLWSSDPRSSLGERVAGLLARGLQLEVRFCLGSESREVLASRLHRFVERFGMPPSVDAPLAPRPG